jgi:hypothetical protein
MMEQGQEPTDKDKWNIISELKKSINPVTIYRNPGMVANDYDTGSAYARGRLYQILREHKYKTIVPGKYLPAYDLINYCESTPYTVDLYALRYHPDSNNRLVTDELIVDICRSNHAGLTIAPYDPDAKFTPAYVSHANNYKKQMICSQYNIDPNRYVILNEWDIFSPRQIAKPNEWIEKQLFAGRIENTEGKAKDDLFVNLPA